MTAVEKNSNILKFTDVAIAHIKATIAKHKDGIGFRLSVKQTGCSGYMYVPEIIKVENKQDVKIAHQTGIFIFIDPNCVELIRGTRVDYVQKSLGMKQLEFNNPNAESLCGCGESFNLRDETNE